jgi:hypothetical protein
MARQYALPEGASRSNREDPRGLSDYIRETAKKYGIDPEVALRVAKSEGLRSFRSGVRTKSGTEEPSWGAFQLYTGGGLGNQFQKDTGLDPSDPKNEKATIDYALKTAAKTGWGPWHGAKNTGIGEYEGISGGAATASGKDPAAGYGGIGSDAAASERAASAAADTQVKGTNISTVTPDVTPDASQTASGPATGDWLDKLKDPKTGAATGLSEAISGLGQAVTGSGKGLYNTAPTAVAPVPVAPTPPPPNVVPMVDPRMADSQRQQLALAMQRLNSGRLV